MPLSESDQEKVSKWLSSKVDHHVCQTCGGEVWAVGDLVFLPLAERGKVQPLVVVQCVNCAGVKLFDSVSLGIWP